MKHMDEIIVGNIGSVYHGTDAGEARKTYKEYKGMSRQGYGRCAYEGVVWMRDGEIYKETDPSGPLKREDDDEWEEIAPSPGPWERDANSGLNCDVRAANGRKVALTFGLQREANLRTSLESAANAVLISTAPEMRTMLRLVASKYKDDAELIAQIANLLERGTYRHLKKLDDKRKKSR